MLGQSGIAFIITLAILQNCTLPPDYLQILTDQGEAASYHHVQGCSTSLRLCRHVTLGWRSGECPSSPRAESGCV